MFPCDFCQIFKKIFFTEHIWATVSKFGIRRNSRTQAFRLISLKRCICACFLIPLPQPGRFFDRCILTGRTVNDCRLLRNCRFTATLPQFQNSDVNLATSLQPRQLLCPIQHFFVSRKQFSDFSSTTHHFFLNR